MGLINKVDMVCLSPVGYPTGDKHTISTLLIKPIYNVMTGCVRLHGLLWQVGRTA